MHAFSAGEETAIPSQAHEPRSESGLPDFDQATFAELMMFIILKLGTRLTHELTSCVMLPHIDSITIIVSS